MSKIVALVAGLMVLVLTAGVRAQEDGIETGYVQTNGINFHYAHKGDGDLVVFLHGYPAFWYMWKEQLANIGEDYFVVAPDMRGYNLSTIPPALEQYQVKYLVEDVKKFAEAVAGEKAEKFVLVGHDWGGLIAWMYAMFYPETLSKLVIINAPHPDLFEREMRDNPLQRQGSDYTFAFNNYDGYNWAEQMGRDGFVGLSQGILGSTLRAGAYTQEDVDKWIESWKIPGALDAGLQYYRANNLNPPYNERHPSETIPTSRSADAVLEGAQTRVIETPTLVIWGMNDTALQGGNLSGIEAYVPNSTFKFYPTDHWVPMTHADEVSRDIREFISGAASAE
ncbi:MAG: alpha/beta hydrolase [Rhodospirillaceae bacterium]